MNKKSLPEAGIRTMFITPDIIAAGWNIDSSLRGILHNDKQIERSKPECSTSCHFGNTARHSCFYWVKFRHPASRLICPC